MFTVIVLTILAVVWLLPIYVAHEIGEPKRRSGFAWGLFLGWFGVIIVALLPTRVGVAPPEPLFLFGKHHSSKET